MAVRRHDRDQLLVAAVDVVLEGGLDALTFGAVARRAGVPDRTVVYYFPRKPDLLGAVVAATAASLAERLGQALGSKRRSPDALLRRLWPVLTSSEVQPLVRVWLDVCVRAGRGGEDAAVAQDLARGWLAFLAERVDARGRGERARLAAQVLARLDGALLLHHLGLPDAAALAVG